MITSQGSHAYSPCEYMRSLATTLFGLLALAVTLFGYPLWGMSWVMLGVPFLLWTLFFMFLVRALKPR